jgi:hypothetical protein
MKLLVAAWNRIRKALLRWRYRDLLAAEIVSEVPDTLHPRTLYVIGDANAWAVAMTCPCGCQEIIHLSLLPSDSPRWNLQLDTDGFATLSPSVWRTAGCGSHFFLKQGSIIWCQDSVERDA